MELDTGSSILSPDVPLGLSGVEVQTYSLLLYLKVKKNQMVRRGGANRWYTWTCMFRVSSGKRIISLRRRLARLGK